MIRFPTSSALLDLPAFSGEAVLRGSHPDPVQSNEAGRVWVEVDGKPESLCFYGLAVPGTAPPLLYLEGDSSQRIAGAWQVFEGYSRLTPHGLQLWAELVALSANRTFLTLARPGVHGSSGDHQQRRRPREVAVVDAALTALMGAFGWTRCDLAGFSGGGHLVAALLTRRSDIGCVVIASGNVSVRQRNRENGREHDITGALDFVDPIALVADVARHPPGALIVLTDPADRIVSAACQTAYVEALRQVGVPVDHRLVTALEPTRHLLKEAAILAAAAHRP